MSKKVGRTFLVAILLLCASCAYHRPDPADRYQRFLGFAEAFIGFVTGAQCACPEESEQLRKSIALRRLNLVAESDGANWGRRYQEVRDVLWVWLAKQRDAGQMTSEQFRYFAAILAAWQ